MFSICLVCTITINNLIADALQCKHAIHKCLRNKNVLKLFPNAAHPQFRMKNKNQIGKLATIGYPIFPIAFLTNTDECVGSMNPISISKEKSSRPKTIFKEF